MIYIINFGKRLEYVKMGENTRLNSNKNKLSESSVIFACVQTSPISFVARVQQRK